MGKKGAHGLHTIIVILTALLLIRASVIDSLILGDPFVTIVVSLLFGYALIYCVQQLLPTFFSSTQGNRLILGLLLLCMIVGRVVYGYSGIEYIYDISLIEIISAGVLVGMLASLVQRDTKSGKRTGSKPAQKKKGARVQQAVQGVQRGQVPWSRWDWVVLFVLTIVAAMQVFVGIGEKNFQNDQFFHVEAAQGYIETGEPIRWDFTANTIQYTEDGEPRYYKRAFTYTWLVAQSARVFGWSEGAARLPSAIWFILFIVGSYLVIRKWSASTVTAGVLVAAFVSFDYLLLQSRITRMYSMLLTVGLSAIYMWFMVYKRSIEKKFDLLFLGYAAIAILLFINAVFTHFLFFIFGVAFSAFIVYEAARSRFADDTKEQNVQLVWLGALVIAGLIATVFVWRVWPFIFEEVGILDSPRLRYELFPFVDMPYQFFGAALYLLGVAWWIRSKELSRRYVAIITACIMLFFVFFVDRYQAMRYILFAIPLYWVVAFITGKELLAAAIERLAIPERYRQAILICALVVFLMPIALPIAGIDDTQAFRFIRESRIVDTHAYAHGHDFETAYNFIRERKSDEHVVYAQSFRTYYWQNDPQLTVVDLLEDKELTLSAFIELHEMHGSGWIVWSNGKEHHMKPKVREYIEQHAQDFSAHTQLQQSNMRVFFLE